MRHIVFAFLFFCSIYSSTLKANERQKCLNYSFDYIFNDLLPKTKQKQNLSKAKVNKIMALRKEAEKLQDEINDMNLSEDEKLNVNSEEGTRYAALNAQITAICFKIEEIAD